MTRINICGHPERNPRAKGLCNSCYKKQRVDKERIDGKNYIKRKRTRISALKESPCMDCGVSYPSYVMDFDHRPDEIKLFTVGDTTRNYGWTKVLEEIAKCDLVCANCHRERTHERRS